MTETCLPAIIKEKDMNRQFHAKIPMMNYVLLAALLSVAISFIWSSEYIARQWIGLLLAVVLVIMIIVIEKIINTTYTITSDGMLVIHNGKFSKDVAVAIEKIERIDRINRYRMGGKPLLTYLVVVVCDGTEHAVMPKNEEDFIKCIKRKRQQLNDSEDAD